MTQPIRIGRVFIEPDEYRLHIDGQRVQLTYMQFRLLAVLAACPNRVCSHGELAAALGSDRIGPRDLAVHVSRLRKKLAEDASLAIVSVPGQGYLLQTNGHLADGSRAEGL